MSAAILAFKAPERDRPSQPARDPGKQALVLALLRQLNAALDAQGVRGQS